MLFIRKPYVRPVGISDLTDKEEMFDLNLMQMTPQQSIEMMDKLGYYIW